jgi:Metallopeptidase toxin 3
MKMGPEDIKKYPDCAKLLHHLRSQVTRKVLDAFFEACQADYLNGAHPAHVDHVARTALLWGGPPLVDVHAGELRVPERGIIVPACGFTDTFPGHAPFVIITHIWFDAYETCGEADRARNAGRLIRTLLHEMVHWVRDAVGAEEDITAGGYRGTAEEAGHYFEMQAYGARNVCNEDNMKDAIGSMRLPV